MSPPIYSPDGSEVSEIVLPDGSTASEVIGPDGNVVFEAGPDIPDSVATRPNDSSSTNLSDEVGFHIELKSDWPSIGARISDNTSGATVAYLRQSDETLIDSIDISGLSSGQSFTFQDANLSSGSQYIISLDNGGDGYIRGFANGASDYPYTSDDVNIVGRYFPGAGGGEAGAINDIGNTGF